MASKAITVGVGIPMIIVGAFNGLVVGSNRSKFTKSN